MRADQTEPRVLQLARGQHAAVTAPQLCVARVTWRQVTGDALGVAARLAAALAA
jgi:hypothetical protein